MANADPVEIDGIYYNLVSKIKSAEVTSNPNKYSGDVTIPETVTYGGEQYSVTSIGEQAFMSCRKLTSVSIPNGVISIGSEAFFGCSSLISVNIPTSINTVEYHAFANCSKLSPIYITDLEAWCKTSFKSAESNPLFYAKHLYLNGEEIKDLVIPNSVSSIYSYTFSGCSTLTSIVIPNSVTSIGTGAFYNCSALTSIILPPSVRNIAGLVFFGCSSLTSVNIPHGITTIDASLFYDCSSLTSIEIPSSVTSIESYAFKGCSGLTSINIPNTVTFIGINAFEGCSGLTSVNIPSSVTSIGTCVFYHCKELTSVTIPSTLRTISNGAFADCPELTDFYCYVEKVSIDESYHTLYDALYTSTYAFSDSYIEYATLHVPEGCVDAYKAIEPWNKFKEIVGMEESTDALEIDGIYYNLDANTKSAEVTSNPNKYSGDVVIPEKIIYGDEVYTVTSIGREAFYACKSLTTAIIPESVTSIGESAFMSCNSLTSISISNNVSYIGKYAFSGCSKLTSVILPDCLTKIDESVFYCCNALTSVTIPESVTSIGHNSFANCMRLTSVVIPNSVTIIGNEAFQYCSSLTSINIPNSVTSIGMSAFEWCSSLTSITIPNNVTLINNYTFDQCSKLSSVTIGSGVEYIVKFAFSNCPELTDFICYAKNIPFTASDVFKSSNIDNATLHVPNSSVDSYKTIEPWKNFKNIIKLPQLIYVVDAETYKTVEPMVGEIIIPEPAPTKEGYTFSGWSEIPETMPDEDVTVTGTFSLNKHKLIYKVDGAEYKNYDVEYGATITPEASPTKEHYTFSGWSEIPETMPDEDVTVTGTFSLNKHKLIYKVDGAEYKNYEVEYGASITPEAVPAKEGYTFSGWDEVPETMPDNDVTISGTFSINKYKLIYKVDGADYKSYDVEYGASITPESAPTKEGYSFSGWSEVPETMPANDVTVTGTFSINKYKLIYKVDGADYKSYDVEYGASITPESAPIKEHYTFSGWSEIPEVMPAKDVTVTGTLIADKFKLVYKVDGADYKSYDVGYGSAITPEAAPTKEHYTFSGWSDIPETMPAEDLTITGTFSLNKHKLIYKVDGVDYKSYDMEYGASITPEAAPTKEHYTFSGWSEIPETMPDNDVTVTGTLIADKFKLIYKVDGTDYKNYEIGYGASITPETAPTKEGYTFSGWSEIPEKMPAKDVTVTGTFSINKYKLIYKVDGADYKSYDVEYGASITPEAAPTKEGYTFSGWSEIPEKMPAKDVTVTGTFTLDPEPTPEPEPKGTTFEEDVDDSATKETTVTFTVTDNGSSDTPTVSLSDDEGVSGNVEIPETVTHNGVEYKVTEISEGAFQNNTGLTDVSIPASITSIGANAFAGCTNLKSITVYNTTPINLSAISARALTRTESGDVFEGVNKETCILYVPEGSVDAYKAAPVWKDFKNILVIGSGTGIKGITLTEGETFDVFNLYGLKVKSKATSLDGLPKGIYVVKGKKVMK